MSNKTLFTNSIITAGDMSQTSLTSRVTKIQFEDNIGLQISWTGSPVGTLAVQVSADQISWISLPTSAFVGTYPVPGTSSSPGYLDINQTSAPFIRLVYTRSSGTGVLNALIVGKGV